MALPRSSAHRSLDRFVGHWRGTGEVMPNPWGPSGPTIGRWTFRLDRNGYNLIADFMEEGADGYWFEAHGVMTADPATDEIVWFWFDSFGLTSLTPMRGRWNETLLVLEKTTPRGIGCHRIECDGDTFRIAVAAKVSGEADFTTVMHGSYARETIATG